MRRPTASEVLPLIKAAALLALIRIVLLVLPFRVVLQAVDRLSLAAAGARPPSANEIGLVLWAVTKAGRYVPGARHCLTRALTAKLLLGRKGRASDLRIGVAKDDAGVLIAHAWLESDGAPLFGVTDAEIHRYSLLPQLDRA
jgi:hypothetical protein